MDGVFNLSMPRLLNCVGGNANVIERTVKRYNFLVSAQGALSFALVVAAAAAVAFKSALLVLAGLLIYKIREVFNGRLEDFAKRPLVQKCLKVEYDKEEARAIKSLEKTPLYVERRGCFVRCNDVQQALEAGERLFYGEDNPLEEEELMKLGLPTNRIANDNSVDDEDEPQFRYSLPQKVIVLGYTFFYGFISEGSRKQVERDLRIPSF